MHMNRHQTPTPSWTRAGTRSSLTVYVRADLSHLHRSAKAADVHEQSLQNHSGQVQSRSRAKVQALQRRLGHEDGETTKARSVTASQAYRQMCQTSQRTYFDSNIHTCNQSARLHLWNPPAASLPCHLGVIFGRECGKLVYSAKELGQSRAATQASCPGFMHDMHQPSTVFLTVTRSMT